jgi:hypothetical protein
MLIRFLLAILIVAGSVQAAKKKSSTSKKSKSTTSKSSSSSRSQSTGGATDIDVNVGLGPAAHILWGSFAEKEPYIYGMELDIYAVITPEILKRNKNKIPQKYRKFLNMDSEMHFTPFPLSLLPARLFISPPGFMTEKANTQAYGATWEFISLGDPLIQSSFFDFTLSARGPTLTVLWLDSPDILDESTTLFGLGINGRAEALLRFSPRFFSTFRWNHQLYAPIGTTKLDYKDTASEELIQHSTISWMLHIRLPYSVKL